MGKRSTRALSSLVLLAAVLPAQDLTATVQPLLDQALKLLDGGDAAAARTELTKAVDLLDRSDADRKLKEAMGLRWNCGKAARQIDEPALEQRCWGGVVDYYERADAGVRADAAQRVWFAQALAELAGSLRGDKQLDNARQKLSESLDLVDTFDKDCRDPEAMPVRYRCGQVAWNLDDRFGGALGQRAWEAVLRFYQQLDPAVLADPAQLAGCQAARNSLATIREKEITPAGFDAAERLRREIREAWDKTGNKGEAALARARLGQLLVQRGVATGEQGMAELQGAWHDIGNARPDSDEAAQIARMYANALRDQGQDLRPLTLQLQQEARRIWSQHPPADPGDVIGLTWELANTVFKNGDFVTARELAQESLAAATAAYTATSLQTYWPRSFYANVLRAMGDHAAAARLFGENLDLCKVQCPASDSTLMHAWLNVGYIAWLEATELERAEREAAGSERAEKAKKARSEKLDEAMKAFAEGEKAIVPEDRTDLALGNVALLYDNWGQCCADRGDSEKAIELLTKAKRLCHGPVAQAQILGGMAMVRQRSGKPDQLKRAAVEFGDSVQLVAATQGYPQAVLYIGRQALTLAELKERDGKRLKGCLEALLAIAKKGAQECYTLPGRPSHQLAKVVDGAAQLVLALAETAGLEKDRKALEQQAFETLETVRSVDLRVVGLARRLSGNPVIEAARIKAQRVRGELASLGSLGVGTAEEVLKKVVTRDEEEFKAFYTVLKGAAPGGVVEVTVDGIAAALPANGAAIAFRTLSLRQPDANKPGHEVTKARLEAHVVTRGNDGKGKFDRVVFKDLARIRSAVKDWRARMGVDRGRDPETDKGPDPATALSSLVWDPLKVAGVASAKVLVVCLDDDLHKVPIELLPGFRDQDREIRYAVSLADLLAKPTGALAPESLFAIGGIDFANAPGGAPATPVDGGVTAAGPRGERGPAVTFGSEAKVSLISFGPLPGTEEEVRSTATTFKECFKREATVLTGRMVTRDAFFDAASKARFLLCATHGYYLPPSGDAASDRDTAVRGFAPMSLCGLALSGFNLTGRDESRGHIGLVTAEDIAGLDLSGCELATLSACGSYLGEMRTGHGLASLQGALHAAGVRAVLTTRWKVSDAATTELITAFYRRMWDQKMGPRKALAAAQEQIRTLHEEWREPRFWAAFVLTGDLTDRK